MPKRLGGKLAGLLALSVTSMGFAQSAAADIPYAAEVTPGALRGIARTADSDWPASYFEYLPSNFDDVPDDHLYPVLVTLGGVGTMDNISVCPEMAPTCSVDDCLAAGGFDGLCRALGRGPAVEIRQGVWDDTQRPFIVIQVQNQAPTSSAVDYDRDEIDALVQFVVDNYPADPRRLYILGNSQGGRGVLQYLAVYARRMAAGTVGPGGLIGESDVGCLLEDTALWAFHGENDQDGTVGEGVFDPCWISRVVHRGNHPEDYPAYPSCTARLDIPYPTSRITMFQNTGHNAWTPAFENNATGFVRPAWTMDEGMCGFDANWVQYDDMEYADGVYTWLLEHDRPGVDAGGTVTVPGTADTATLALDVVDDDAWTATWTQTGGPAVTMTPGMDGTLVLTDFAYDTTYTFAVRVVDADNQWNDDTVEVTIEPEVIGGGSSSSGGGSESSSGGDSSGDSTSGDSTTGGGSGPDTITTSSSEGTSASGSASGSDTSAGDTPAGMGSTGTDTDTGTDGGSAELPVGCRAGGGSSLGWLALVALGFVRRRIRC